MARPEEFLNTTASGLTLDDFDEAGNLLPTASGLTLDDLLNEPSTPDDTTSSFDPTGLVGGAISDYSAPRDTRSTGERYMDAMDRAQLLGVAYELTQDLEIGKELKEFTLAYAEGAANRWNTTFDPYNRDDRSQFTDSTDFGDEIARGLGDVTARMGILAGYTAGGAVTGGVGGLLAGPGGAGVGAAYGAKAGFGAGLFHTMGAGSVSQVASDVKTGAQKIKEKEGRDATREEKMDIMARSLPFRVLEETGDTLLSVLGMGWTRASIKAAKARGLQMAAERTGTFWKTLGTRSLTGGSIEGVTEALGGAGGRAAGESVARGEDALSSEYAQTLGRELTSPENLREAGVATAVGALFPFMGAGIDLANRQAPDPEIAPAPEPQPAALPYDPGEAQFTEVPDDQPIDDYTATEEGLRIAEELVERGELDDPRAAQAVYLSRVIGELENPYSKLNEVFIPTEIISSEKLAQALEKDTHLRVTTLSDNDGYTKVEVIPGAPTQVDRFFARQEEQRKNLVEERDTLVRTLEAQQKLYERQLAQERELNEQVRALTRQIKKAPLDERAELKKQLQEVEKNYADLLTKQTSSEDAVMNSRMEDRIGKLEEEIGMIDAVTKATDDLDALRLLPQTENTLPLYQQFEKTLEQELNTKTDYFNNLTKQKAALEKALKRLETQGVKDTRFSQREARKRKDVIRREEGEFSPPLPEGQLTQEAEELTSQLERIQQAQDINPEEGVRQRQLQEAANRLYDELNRIQSELDRIKGLDEKARVLDPALRATRKSLRSKLRRTEEKLPTAEEPLPFLRERLSELQARNREAEENISSFKDFLTAISEQDAETRKGTFERSIRTEGDLLSRANRERTRLDSLDTESAQLRRERAQIDDDILSIEKQKEQLEVKRAADQARAEGVLPETQTIPREELTEEERNQLIDLDEEANRLAETQLLIDQQLRGIQAERTRVAEFLNTLENRLNPRTEQTVDDESKAFVTRPNEFAQPEARTNFTPTDAPIDYQNSPQLSAKLKNDPRVREAEKAATFVEPGTLTPEMQQVNSRIIRDFPGSTVKHSWKERIVKSNTGELIYRNTYKDAFLQKWQDRFKPIERAELVGRELNEMPAPVGAESAIKQLRLFMGYGAKLESIISRGPLNAQNQHVLPGGLKYLVEPYARAGTEEGARLLEAKAEIYGLALRAIEKAPQLAAKRKRPPRKPIPVLGLLEGADPLILNNYDSEVELAEEIVEQIKADPNFKDIEEGLERYRQWANVNLQRARDRGVISQKAYNAIRDANLSYIATQRLVEMAQLDENIDWDQAVRKAATSPVALDNVLKRFRGGNQAIIDPYVSLIELTDRLTREGDRNALKLAFVDNVSPRTAQGAEQVDKFEAIAKKISDPGNVSNPNIIKLKRNGKVEAWLLAPDIAAAFKQLDAASSMPYWARFPAELLRFGVTYTVPFAVRNRIRDTVRRLVISDTGNRESINATLRKMTPLSIDELNRTGAGFSSTWYMRNKLDYARAMDAAIRDTLENSNDLVFDLRKIGHSFEGGIEDKIHTLQDIAHDSAYGRWIQNQELANRIAEYNAAKEELKKEHPEWDEYTIEIEAANRSRGLIDFMTMGEWVRPINQVVPFTNAAIQGLTRDVKGAIEHPKVFGIKWSAFIGLPTLATYALAQIGDYEEEYDALPRYQRYLFWNFKLFDQWIRIPKPHELGVLAYGLEYMIDAARGKDVDFDEASFAESLVPFSMEDVIGGPFRALYNAGVNYDNFREKYIVPPWEAKKDLELRNPRGASELGQAVQALAETFGLGDTDFGRTFGDARTVDFLIANTFGTMGQMATRASNIDSPESAVDTLMYFSGLTAQEPAVNSPDVQFVFDYMDRKDIGFTNKTVEPLRNMINEYYNAEDSEKKSALAKSIREFGSAMRDQIEESGEVVFYRGNPKGYRDRLIKQQQRKAEREAN